MNSSNSKLLKKNSLLENELVNYKKDFTLFNNFTQYFNETKDLICLANLDGYFTKINEAFTESLGYTEKELLSKQFTNFIAPEDIDKTLKEFENLNKGQNTINFSNRYIKKDGGYINLNWHAIINLETKTIFAIARDVTDVEQTKEKLITNQRLLNESQKMAKIGSFEFNLQTHELVWSEELYNIFEIDPKEKENLYQLYVNKIPPEYVTLLNNKLQEAIIEKKSYEIEHTIILDNGSKKWILGYGEPVVDKNNEVIKIRGIAKDISTQKEFENTLKAKEYAEATSQAKTEFLANMSHEIRTPLNGIIGFTDLLIETKLNKSQQVYMQNINQSANLLLEIINDILEFSKVESGKLELSLEPLSLYDLTNQIINLFTIQASLKNIHLRLEYDSNIPNLIEADALRLKQILVNLISNAIKFTSFGEVVLQVDLINLKKNKFATIKFSVIDTGKGIKKENLEKIFNSFVQEDASTTKKFGGTGLGLAIVNKLLSYCKSKINVKSAYGEGSNFNFIIDFKIPNNTILKTDKKEEVEENPMIKQNLKNLSILLVEDNVINILLANKILNKIFPKSKILKAENGEIALEILNKNKVDIILLDIQMPIKNGYETAFEIKFNEKTKNIPIIALTAGIMESEKQKCLDAGMDDYISKPYKLLELLTIINKYI
jgi:PAS domain S-box-containing protein